jgi:hypothetical protein
MVSPSHGYLYLPQNRHSSRQLRLPVATLSSVTLDESHGVLGPADQLPVSYRTLGADVKTMQCSFASWPTSEQFTLRHATDNPAEYFLMWGERFSESDWKRIETGKNQLRPDLRATVWVCDNSGNPVVDWQPAKD